MSLDFSTIRLRHLARSDRPAISSAIGLLEVAKNLTAVPHPYSQGKEWDWVEPAQGRSVFAVVGKVDGREVMLGTVGMRCESDMGHIGYFWIAPDYWGQGIGTRAIELILSKAVAAGFKQCKAEVMKDNPASRAIFEKCGFKLAGCVNLYSRARNTTVPCWCFIKAV